MKQELTLNPNLLIQTAIEKGADIDKLERLMALGERWQKAQAQKSFNEAFNQFQENKPVITKSKDVTINGQKRFSFAELSTIQAAVDPVLSQYGLSYSWRQQDDNGKIKITFVLKHVDGHSEINELSANPDTSGSKNSIQSIGSGVSYLKRYTLLNGLGLSTGFDDDGISSALTPEEQREAAKDKLMALIIEKKDVAPEAVLKRANEVVNNEETISYAKAIKALEKC